MQQNKERKQIKDDDYETPWMKCSLTIDKQMAVFIGIT